VIAELPREGQSRGAKLLRKSGGQGNVGVAAILLAVLFEQIAKPKGDRGLGRALDTTI
jgi:hypothetical protein